MQKRLLHRILLIIYHLLIISKRILWKTGRFLFFSGHVLGKRTVVPLFFLFYRLYLKIKHLLRLEQIPFSQRAHELLAHPRFLLVFTLGLMITLLLPYTRFTTKAAAVVTTGNEPVLFHLVGPGEEYFVDEIIIEPLAADIEAWDSGATRPRAIELETEQEPEHEELGSLVLGGTALTKPNILPGAYESTRTETITYVVQPGNTIGGIAQAFGVSVNTLLWENNLNFYSYIRPGQALRVLPVNGVSHTIKKGETLSKIAKTYKVDVEKIIEANRIADESKLTVGYSLLIPGGTKGGYVNPATSAASARFRGIASAPPSIVAPAGSRYIWPAAVRRITQYFGWRHAGVDIAGPVGTVIYAARAGRVTYSQCGWNGGYGCNVRIDHGNGVTTLYGHAATGQLFVKIGDRVQQGQAIAGMGSTGRSSGPHLHFEIRVNGRQVNPLQYIR